MIRLTNKSGGLIVCDLKSKDKDNIKTLRLKNNQSEVINENEVTKHIENLIAKGLVRKEVVKDVKPVEKTAAKKEKEEV